MKKIIYLMMLFFSANCFAQTKDPAKILDAVKQKFDLVHNYEADVNIHVDINFIKMPDRKAKIYFKQPDKMKFHSDGFALLPKQGFNFSPVQLLKGDYNSIFVRVDQINGKKLDVIKIIPNSDSSDVVLSTLWIDETEKVIQKVETVGKKSGNISIDFKYIPNQTLPTEVKFTFNLGDAPTAAATQHPDQNNAAAVKPMARGPIKGTATLTYSNYKINQGIPDNIFDEKKK
jgi:outer membrane lipoprotein-sorting protein